MTDPLNVAIFIFDEVEVLDFAGPFEVFNVTSDVNDPPPFNTYTIALSEQPIHTRGGLQIVPTYSIANCPPPHILIIPGGFGTRALLQNGSFMDWLKQQFQRPDLQHLLSVCTGSLALAGAGLLKNLPATTHHTTLNLLAALDPSITVVTDQRFVDNGRILTAGGISAGIDLALYMVQQLAGDAALQNTLKEMEYGWFPPYKG